MNIQVSSTTLTLTIDGFVKRGVVRCRHVDSVLSVTVVFLSVGDFRSPTLGCLLQSLTRAKDLHVGSTVRKTFVKGSSFPSPRQLVSFPEEPGHVYVSSPPGVPVATRRSAAAIFVIAVCRWPLKRHQEMRFGSGCGSINYSHRSYSLPQEQHQIGT